MERLKEIRFTVVGEPTGKGRPRFVTRYNPITGEAYGQAHTPEKTILYENLVKMEYLDQVGGFRFDDNTQIAMHINAYYSIPKSKSKRIKREMLANNIRPTKKPDMDNVVKIIADSLNKVAYKDDTQIVSVSCEKWYSEEPRVEICMYNI